MTTLMTITESNISLVAYDRGDDVQVFIKTGSGCIERWFSVYTGQRESFKDAATRVFKRIAEEYNTVILPVV